MHDGNRQVYTPLDRATLRNTFSLSVLNLLLYSNPIFSKIVLPVQSPMLGIHLLAHVLCNPSSFQLPNILSPLSAFVLFFILTSISRSAMLIKHQLSLASAAILLYLVEKRGNNSTHAVNYSFGTTLSDVWLPVETIFKAKMPFLAQVFKLDKKTILLGFTYFSVFHVA